MQLSSARCLRTGKSRPRSGDMKIELGPSIRVWIDRGQRDGPRDLKNSQDVRLPVHRQVIAGGTNRDLGRGGSGTSEFERKWADDKLRCARIRRRGTNSVRLL